ncbi:MAG TPA: hypothetical protein VF263_07875, partial [Longimicrobiaceae bacterium]
MKIRTLAVALALSAAPLPLLAQNPSAPAAPRERAERPARAERGMRGVRGAEGFRSPVTRLVERREQLGLTAAQVSRLQAIEQRLRSQNQPLVERMRALH